MANANRILVLPSNECKNFEVGVLLSLPIISPLQSYRYPLPLDSRIAMPTPPLLEDYDYADYLRTLCSPPAVLTRLGGVSYSPYLRISDKQTLSLRWRVDGSQNVQCRLLSNRVPPSEPSNKAHQTHAPSLNPHPPPPNLHQFLCLDPQTRALLHNKRHLLLPAASINKHIQHNLREPEPAAHTPHDDVPAAAAALHERDHGALLQTRRAQDGRGRGAAHEAVARARDAQQDVLHGLLDRERRQARAVRQAPARGRVVGDARLAGPRQTQARRVEHAAR